MFKLGDLVVIKPPFDEAFPGPHAVTEIVKSDDGTTAYILGEAGGFDASYLEPAP